MPINVWAGGEEEIARLMSNLSPSPVVIDGRDFGSVEAFISWLVTDPAKIEKRRRIRRFWGRRAKTCGPKIRPERISYDGRDMEVGEGEFYELIKRAIRIKLETYPEISARFAATHPRPIVHIIHGEPKSPSFVQMIEELREELVHTDLSYNAVGVAFNKQPSNLQ